MPRYFREFSKELIGDKELASSYIPFAAKILGGLKEMSGEVLQNIRRVVLPDGTRITVRFAGVEHQVTIDVRATTPDELLRYCPKFISGVVAVSETITVEVAGEEVKKLRWFYPSEYEQETT